MVTMDRERRVLPGGTVTIADGVIEAVRAGGQVGAGPVPDRIIDGRTMAVLPGLVNAHTHLNETLLKGLTSELSLIPWVTAIGGPAACAINLAECRVAAELGCLEMICSGTTCFADMFCQRGQPRVLDVVADAVGVAGLRGVLSRFFGFAGVIPDATEDDFGLALRDTVETRRDGTGATAGRLRFRLAPGSMLAVPPGRADRLRSAMRDGEFGLHTHMAEVDLEPVHLRREYGASAVAYAHRHGLLGPATLAAHCVHPTSAEIDLLASSGAAVVYNPVTNMKLADGVAPIPEMLARGVTVALGTDGAGTNDSLDMFEAMKVGSYLQKVHHRDASLLPALQMLEMATLGGARALGLEDMIGSIEAGKRGDLILVNLRSPNIVPVHTETVLNQLVCSATGADVDTVLVDGQVLMQGRRVLTLNQNEVVERAQSAARALVNRMADLGRVAVCDGHSG